MSNNIEVRYEKTTSVGENYISETIEGTSEAVLKVLSRTESDKVVQNLSFHIAPGFKIDEAIKSIKDQFERVLHDGNGY